MVGVEPLVPNHIPAACLSSDGDVWMVSGEIDLGTLGEFESLLATSIDSECGSILDMSGVAFIDSSGLAALIRCRDGGHEVMITNPSPSVRRVLEVTAIGPLFGVEPDATEDDRLASHD